ncbi:Lipopolysaccharide assembly protein A [Polaribacter huanghezhanensis]|uniref:LapA family protein n=1 Tax=Polaribacter huanghezhanensis TaxID=1354726 RepID=UPI0026490789|nr:LapA family protein [Polaribacter huanghezhanensis]WKD84731.1 Lipopolysaccharide assembly protein A [Polaribacter huanghezhanensis]
MKTKTIVSLFFVLIIVIFSLQNSEITDVDFLFWKISVSRILIILGSFSFGVLVGILVSMVKKTTTTKETKSEA